MVGVRRGAAVDIGLPVFNGANYLREGVESLLAQDYENLTLWISDNGSTDETAELIAELAAGDQRIRTVRSAVNHGAAWNFNHVFSLGTAPYFAWAAHDDLRDPSFLPKTTAVLDDDPQLALCFALTRFVDEAGRTIPSPVPPEDARLEPRPHRRLDALLGSFPMHIVFGVARREMLARTRLWGSMASADGVLTNEIALQGPLARIDEPLFIRRFHDKMSWYPDISEDEYARWYDPDATRRALPVVQRGIEYCRAVRHARLGLADELACHAMVAKYAMWNHGALRLRRYARRAIGRPDGDD